MMHHELLQAGGDGGKQANIPNRTNIHHLDFGNVRASGRCTLTRSKISVDIIIYLIIFSLSGFVSFI